MENTQNENTNIKSGISNFITPLAIIIAGILIALSLYLKDSNQNSNTGSALVKNALTTGQQPKFSDISSVDHIRGSKNAKIVFIEYSDTECPFCKVYHETMKKIYNDFGKDGDIAWVYRHFPISYGDNPLHPEAAKQAEATECAAELGGNDMFWTYIDKLYEVTQSNNSLQKARLYTIADEVGLDKDKFRTCLDSDKYAQKIRDSYDNALASGARGTPYTVIKYKNEFIPLLDNQGNALGALPYDALKQVIDELLSK